MRDENLSAFWKYQSTQMPFSQSGECSKTSPHLRVHPKTMRQERPRHQYRIVYGAAPFKVPKHGDFIQVGETRCLMGGPFISTKNADYFGEH